ncbi:transposase, partial [Beijerinckia mobilis]|uniref:transposase n=1 Tax=Beijerinckia mobilis TaxID=231434 RepID=UPI00146FD99A
LPITLKLTEGQAHDGKSAEDMLEDLNDGQILHADRAYDSDAARNWLAARGAWANIKPISHPLTTCWDVLAVAREARLIEASTLDKVEEFLNHPAQWSTAHGGIAELKLAGGVERNDHGSSTSPFTL